MKLILIFLILINLTSCGDQNTITYEDCTNSLNFPGVEFAQKINNTCIVNSCLPRFEKFNMQYFIQLATAKQLLPQNSINSLIQLSKDTPIFCIESTRTCSNTTVNNGQTIFQGNKIINNYTSLNATTNQGQVSEFNSLLIGYGNCFPVDQNSCANGYVFDQKYLNIPDSKFCTPEYLDCTTSFNTTSVLSAHMPYHYDTKSYSTNECLITACQPGYQISSNYLSCDTILPPI
jgi:hypothetical protein